MVQEEIKHWFRDLDESGNIPVHAIEWERAAKDVQDYLDKIKVAIATMLDCEEELVVSLSTDWTAKEIDTAMANKYCHLDPVFRAAMWGGR